MHKVDSPKFELRFLGPKFWPLWIGAGFLYLLSWMPFFVIRFMSKGFAFLLSKLGKKRVKVAKRNLELCFPQWSEQKRQEVLKQNVQMTGMALFETVMGWWWPDWRVRRHGKVEGFEHVEAILQRGKGVLCLAPHMMNLEFGLRLAGLHQASVAFYRRHDNALMEYLQYHGRARSNKYMIHKRDVKGMFQALSNGEISYYLPDQDYGRKRCEFAPFFAVEQAATTTGTLLFANHPGCEIVFVYPIYTRDGYRLHFEPGVKDFPTGDDNADVTLVNQRIEQMIMQAPEQYLWMHKRFKTRPDPDEPSLYK